MPQSEEQKRQWFEWDGHSCLSSCLYLRLKTYNLELVKKDFSCL